MAKDARNAHHGEDRLAAEEKFLNTPTSEMVDGAEIKRKALWNGALSGAGWGLAVAAAAAGGVGLLALTGALSSLPSFGIASVAALNIGWETAAIYAAGALGLGAVAGGVLGAGHAYSQSDELVEMEIARVERKKQMIAHRRLTRREMGLRNEQQEIEYLKQAQALGLTPTPGLPAKDDAMQMGSV